MRQRNGVGPSVPRFPVPLMILKLSGEDDRNVEAYRTSIKIKKVSTVYNPKWHLKRYILKRDN